MSEERDADQNAIAGPATKSMVPWIVVGTMSILWAAVFIVWSLHKYDNFFARRFDLGNMVQAVWVAANGDLTLTTTDTVGEQISRFAGHFEPILILFAPLWRIWPSPTMLLVVQAIAIASTAIPVFMLARVWLRDQRLAILFAAMALAYPFIQAQTLFDFHPVSLATPLLMWAIWAAVTSHNIVLALTVVLAVTTKEQVGLAVLMFGIWMIISLGRRRAGAAVAVFGFAWSAVVLGGVMPRLRSTGAEQALLSRYDEFGDSITSAIANLVLHPIRSAELLATGDRIAFVLAFLVPLAFLPLRAPLLALCAAPDLMINLMSSHPQQKQVAFHYGAVIAPFLFAAAIRGFAALHTSRHGRVARATRPAFAIPTLAALTLASSWLLSPLPFWGDPPMGRTAGVQAQRAELVVRDEPRVASMRAAVRIIPKDAVISVGNGLGAHLSARRRVLTFPVVSDARWIAVDRQLGAMGDGRDPRAHRERVDRLLRSGHWGVVFDQEQILVLRRIEERR